MASFMSTRKPYHHGNLREALLEASIQLIGEIGPTAFTLREVARRAGVSHNAPYRHFHDKNALLAAVAAQGYDELTEAMTKAAGQHVTPRDRLKHAGLAYIAFALRRPEHFTVMFDAPLPPQEHPDAAQASKRSFSVLLDLVHACQDKEQSLPQDPLPFALLAWSMVHGIAKLAITDRLPYRSRTKVLEFASFVIEQSLPLRFS
jgi:AcrR family transcriptional regulator